MEYPKAFSLPPTQSLHSGYFLATLRILQTTLSPDRWPLTFRLKQPEHRKQEIPLTRDLRSTREAPGSFREWRPDGCQWACSLCHHHSHEEAQDRCCSVRAPVHDFARSPLPPPPPTQINSIYMPSKESKQGDPRAQISLSWEVPRFAKGLQDNGQRVQKARAKALWLCWGLWEETAPAI